LSKSSQNWEILSHYEVENIVLRDKQPGVVLSDPKQDDQMLAHIALVAGKNSS